MKSSEIPHILTAILVLTIIAGFSFALEGRYELLAKTFGFSALTILVTIFSKKIAAHMLDADVEHEIWQMRNLGFQKSLQLKKPIPMGILLPLILSFFTLGIVKFSALLTYETRASKYRAAKRFGFYSFKEMTDWHHALIGAAGIVSLLILAIIAYILPGTNLEYLSKISIYYAFWNILPISKLDGAQIFFGSRILWTTLASITTIAAILAISIP